MSPETCSIPDNTFTNLDILLPSELSAWVVSETRGKILDCFIESLHISSWSEIFTQVFKEVLKYYGEQDFLVLTQLDWEYIEDILFETVNHVEYNFPEEYTLLQNDNSKSYIIINGVSINFQKFLWNENNQDIATWWVYFYLEWERWFQEDRNNGMTLNDALKQYGFPRYVLDSLSEIFWRELSDSEIYMLKLLIQYVISIESQYWYNLVREDVYERPSWYFQYQVNDGDALKEIYNFQTRSFEAAWSWWDTDIEIKKLQWNNKIWVRKVWWRSSYDMALNNLPDSIRESNSQFSHDFNNIWNPQNQNLMNLNSGEQIVLFLSDSFNKTSWREYLNRILSGDKNAIVEMYIENHNTNRENGSKRSRQIYTVIKKRAQEILSIKYS